MKYKYTNLEKIKFLMDNNKEAKMINKYIMPEIWQYIWHLV